MRGAYCFCSASLFFLFLSVVADAQPRTAVQKIDSPRIASLWSDIQSGDQTALSRFWEEMKGHAPLWERIIPPGKNNGFFWVTFIWRGNDRTRNVYLEGELPTRGQQVPLEHLPDTDVWYLSEYTPSNARLSYDFVVVTQKTPAEAAREVQLDPNNPHTFNGSSVFELPYAPPQPWIERLAGVPEGKVTRQSLYSTILDQQRDFAVYTPAGYSTTGKPCNLLVLLDGQSYMEEIPVPVIRDNLLGKQRIEPTVAVLILSDHTDSLQRNTRTFDYTCNRQFADFVVKELLPWVRQRYRVSSQPKSAVIGGHSLGGLQATYIGFLYPNVFGNVLSESGSFFYFQGWPMHEGTFSTQTGWLIMQFASASKKSLHLYLETGTFEGEGLAENRRMRDVLIAKGYPLTYSEYSGGHDQFCWRGTFGSGLLALIGRQRKAPGGSHLSQPERLDRLLQSNHQARAKRQH